MEGSASPMRDTSQDSRAAGKGKGANTDNVPAKRRCVSTACIACRRRKSKCDGNLPSCAACSSVYHTPCIYDPSSDHRRKGAYRKDTGPARTTKNTTLQTLIHAILNYSEKEAFDLVRQIRSCENLEDVADSVINEERGLATPAAAESGRIEDDAEVDQFESELSDKFSELMLDGSRKFIGGTSNLIFLPPGSELYESSSSSNMGNESGHHNYQVSHWTDVTDDEQLISHLMTMYFTWHYPFFTTLSRDLFYRDYVRGISSQYCSSLLVNAILALGCHFSSWEGARKDPQNSATAGDHFFKEAKRLVLENDEHANAKLCTVQALALMSVREAGCGREGKGWTYSGMSFRMAFDLGLNLNVSSNGQHTLSDEEVDARRVTFWGCYLFDKCWSNYLGRQPQLTTSNSNVPAVDILPNEEAGLWAPYTDNGIGHENMQPSRIRAVASQMFKLSEISGDLLLFFYLPMSPERPPTKQVELKKLSEIHTRLEAWKKALPRELESKEEQLPQVLLMHMFYNLLLIHLYRPFLKYTRSNSPLPQNVSPRRLCTQAASTISKLLRIYKRTYGFNQICNIAVYIAHTACTIHLLSLPEKNAQKDIIHGLRSLEEMGDSWLCARRTLRILDISANKWQVPLPQDASMTFERTHARWGLWGSWDQATSPSTNSDESPAASTPQRSAAASSKTSMLETPPPTSAPKSTPSTQTPAEGVTAMTPQYQRHESSATPATISTMRTARRSVSVQLQKPDNDFIPEPTYLKPISHMYLPFQAVPLTQHEAWYDSNDQRIHTLDNSQSSPSSTEISSLTGFGSPTNLVEESQGWWSRDPSTLGFGMGNWDDAWGVSMPNTSAAAPVAPTALQQPGISGQAPSPSESLQFPVAVPNPNISEPGQDPNMYVYNSMAFQGNFQP